MAKKAARTRKRRTAASSSTRKGRPENLRPWQPGQSGNPGGRPRGFVARIKELTGGDDYPRLAEGLAVLAFGSAAQRHAFFGEKVGVTARDRLKALVELRDSGPGRPTQTIEGLMSPVPAFSLPPGCEPDVGARPPGFLYTTRQEAPDDDAE